MRETLMSMFYKLDSVTINHSVRVMCIAEEVESYYCMENHLLSRAALLHDIGKVYVSGHILDKTTALTALERGLVNLHPYIGYLMLKEHGLHEDLCRLVLYHHGSNPVTLEKLKPYENREIQDLAHLLRSIDAYEAMTSDRPYHRGCHASEAYEVMERECCYDNSFLIFLKLMLAQMEKGVDSAVFRNQHRVEVSRIDDMLEDIERLRIIREKSVKTA